MSNDPHQNIARAYDRWSATYDSDINVTRDLDAEVLRSAPINVAGKHVLELGCGTGKNTAWLATVAEKVTALDFSAGMLARARERVPTTNVEFITHYLREAWPLRPASVGVVIGNLVLEHIQDIAAPLAEAARVITKGGQLFLCELHPYRQLRGAQAHFADERGEIVAVTAYRHTISEYVNAAIGAGFTIVALREWSDRGAEPDAPPRLLSLLCERD